MRRLFAFLFAACSIFVQIDATEYDIPQSIRFTLEREESSSSIVYYFSPPDAIEKPYPIFIICDGSESKGGERSILLVRDFFAERVRSLGAGYIAIEKCGIDGKEIDKSEFWNRYTRSQRLKDHLQVIHYLEEHPPNGWNGQFLFAGVSEGGPLVTDLSIICPNTIATVNWSGAGDWSWADELWRFFEHWKQNSFWIRLYDAIPRWVPFSSDIPPTRPEFDALVQEIISNPTPDLWMGGMTYLYHADAFEKPPVDYTKIKTPFLVVAGAEDSIIESCDQFVQKAIDAGAPVTYFRVDGMDHYIRKRPDVIDQSFDWLQQQIVGWENMHDRKQNTPDFASSFFNNLTPEEHPTLLAIGGGPCSGKTTWRRKMQSELTNYFLHDMDEVMVLLPGYQEDFRTLGGKVAFEKWWPFARELSEEGLHVAIASRFSILYDRTCGAESSYQDLLQAKSQGYVIRLIGLTVDHCIGLERAMARQQAEGRVITEEIIDEYRHRFSTLWPKYLSFVDEASLYDTTNDPPKLIFSSATGVIDPVLYERFLAEGK